MVVCGIFLAIVGLSIAGAASNALAPEHQVSKQLRPFDLIANIRTLVADPRPSILSNLPFARFCFLVPLMHLHTVLAISPPLMHMSERSMSGSDPFIETLMSINAMSVPLLVALSAALSVTSWLPVMQKPGGKGVSFPHFAVIRILRTLPVVGAYILLTQSYPLFRFAGPAVLHVQTVTRDLCRQVGWMDLAFLSNLLPITRMCAVVTWVISVDVQMYLLSFPILRILARNERLGIKLLVTQIVIGCLASAAYSHHYNLLPVFAWKGENMTHIVTNYAAVVHHTIHFIPIYPIGMLLGLAIHKLQGVRRPVGGLAVMASLSVTLAFIAAAGKAYDGQGRFFFNSKILEFLFLSTARSVACTICCFNVYALVNATDASLTAVATSRFLVILSRLSFSINVFHVFVIQMLLASMETTNDSSLQQFMVISSVTFFSIILGAVVYLLIESPAHLLLMRFLRGSSEDGKRDERSSSQGNGTELVGTRDWQQARSSVKQE